MSAAISSLRALLCGLSLIAAWSQHAGALRLNKPGPRGRAPSGEQVSRRSNVAINSTTYSCAAAAPSVAAPRANVWAPLTEAESASVVEWLFMQKALNLTASANASAWDNTITMVELLFPNKTDALPFLDCSGCHKPARYAKVILAVSVIEDAYYQEIAVGPLPISNATQWRPIDWTYTRSNADGKVRNLWADQGALYGVWLQDVQASVSNITDDLWGTDKGPIAIFGTDPLLQGEKSGRLIRWDAFWRDSVDFFNTLTLQPLGLYVRSDVTGRDPSKWKVTGWFYNNIFYESTEAFAKAYWSPGFQKLGGGFEAEWATTDQAGPPLPRDDRAPPMATTPTPARFAVDTEQLYVEWMGFSFYFGYSWDVGLTLYDIRYNGTRIMYELGMQEALSHYAGNDPFLSASAYFDTFYGFGIYNFELIPGYDCPPGATYLDSTFFRSDALYTHPNSICLFELDGTSAINRHTTQAYASAAKNTQFAIRTVATVGNYDYTVTYIFALDGSITADVKASGYIEGGHSAHNEDYGFHIHDFLSGAMHDHVINFKADLDVLGTANSLEFVSNKPLSKVYPWSDGQVRNTMSIERTFITNEDHARFNWAPNSATQVLVVNKDKPNRLGEYPGWRILGATGGAHLTIQDSSTLLNSGRWAEFDVQVTRQKDTEPRAVHPYNNMDTPNPPVDFSKFFNSESLEQQDLVVWVNMGMHHVPHTGDLPNTVMTSAHGAIQFLPSNYLPGDPSVRAASRVRVNYDKGVVNVTKAGRPSDVCVNDLSRYTGDYAVHLNPYDPQHPFYDTYSIP